MKILETNNLLYVNYDSLEDFKNSLVKIILDRNNETKINLSDVIISKFTEKQFTSLFDSKMEYAAYFTMYTKQNDFRFNCDFTIETFWVNGKSVMTKQFKYSGELRLFGKPDARISAKVNVI